MIAAFDDLQVNPYADWKECKAILHPAITATASLDFLLPDVTLSGQTVFFSSKRTPACFDNFAARAARWKNRVGVAYGELVNPYFLASILGSTQDLKRVCPNCKKAQTVPSNMKQKTVWCKFCGSEIPSEKTRY